ncbi:MAG: hypothetical protein LUH03_10060 [Oscillospiraceae bacterium]|nr:hypothetical protein [Oscillospiraceae bacterium]
MTTFEGLQPGDHIIAQDGTLMEVMIFDYFLRGKVTMCFADEHSIYPATEFSPQDWEKVR